MRTYLCILTVALAIAGCTTQDYREQARQQSAGQPLDYQDGYVDGCVSGYKAAGNPYAQFTKQARRFDDDKLYRQGWTDGFDICKAEYDGISGRGGRVLRRRY